MNININLLPLPIYNIGCAIVVSVRRPISTGLRLSGGGGGGGGWGDEKRGFDMRREW